METVEKMVEWVQEHVAVSPAPRILDIGTGNGQMLISLVEAGYDTSLMLGVDYSLDSIRLARLVAESHGAGGLAFEVADFLSGDAPRLPAMEAGEAEWDLLLDKGTYDAIALASAGADGAFPKDTYPLRAARLLKPGALFLVTCMPARSHRGLASHTVS